MALLQPTTPTLDELVASHQHAVWRYLRALGARPDVADELLQDTFVLAWQKGVPATAAAGAFLRGVARHLWLRAQRAWHRRRETAIADAVDTMWTEDDDGDDAVHALRECLQRLQGRSREALEQMYRDGRSRRQIATAFGMKENGLKMLLQRARAALRECMTRSRG